MIRSGRRVRFVELGDVIRIVSGEVGVVVHTAAGAFPWRETLQHVAACLDPGMFVRVDRSALVNARRIRQLRVLPGGECAIVLDDGAVIHTSRGYRELLAQIESLAGFAR